MAVEEDEPIEEDEFVDEEELVEEVEPDDIEKVSFEY